MREGYSKSLGPLIPTVFGELDLIFVKLGAGSGQAALVAADSSPDITVATPGSGVYNLTLPKGTRGWVIDPTPLASPGTAPGDKITVTAFSATAGTLSLTKSDTTNLTGSEQIHLLVLLSRKDASVAG